MTIKIYVGDVNEELAVAAQTDNPSAFLIDHHNYREFLSNSHNSDIVAYTSLGDLPKDLKVFFDILTRASEIVYLPPDQWSDHATLDHLDPEKSIQGLTENILLQISDQVPVKNIELCCLIHDPDPLVASRVTNRPQLWSAGCSFTHGSGITANQRYGQLLSDELGIPCSFLTKPGSSLSWAAGQILRSDIRPKDVVVWGLTTPDRVTYIHNKKILPINVSTYLDNPAVERILPMSVLFNENTFYQNCYAVEQVINFCQKNQANLILFGVLISNSFLRYAKLKNNFYRFPHKLSFSDNSINNRIYADLGSDNLHPGPIQHQHYKNFLLRILKNQATS
jgi:hypothetical protein